MAQNTRSKAGAKRNELIVTNQPGSRTKNPGVNVQVTSIKTHLKPKNRNPVSPVEGQHSNFPMTGMDLKQKVKPGSGSPRNKSTPSQSSQSDLTVSTESTTTLDMSQSEETRQDTLMVTVKNYYKEPKRAGSSRSRETSLSSPKLDSSWNSQTPQKKEKTNPGHKGSVSSKEMKKTSVEPPSSPLVPHARSELVEKCKALQLELEVVKKERDQGRRDLEDKRATVRKYEEDRRAIIDEKEKVKKENEKLKNEMIEIKSQMNHHEAENTHRKPTNSLLPECDEGSGHHSLPEQLRAELNGEAGMQRHISFHHKKVEQTVKVLEDKTRYLGYNVEACVSPVKPQAELVTLKEDLEKLLKEKEEEIDHLNQTITELRQSVRTQDIEESDCVIVSRKESGEVKSLKKEIGRLKNMNYELMQTLSATNDALRQLQEEKTCNQQQLQSLKEELSQLQGENKTAKAKHVAAQSDVKPSQAQETIHEEELMSLRKDRDRLQKENKRLEAVNSKLEESISGLLITSRQHRNRLSKEQADKQQQMEPLQKENKVLKADKTKLLKTLQDQFLTANHRIEELDVEKAEAHRQVKLIQEEIDELKANQGELQDQLQSANHQLDQVCAEKVQLQHQVESLQRQVTKYPGDIAKLENELESANRRVTKLEEELDTAKEEIEAWIQHEAKITREFRTSVEEKGKLEKEIKTLQKENEDLKGEITKFLKSVSNQLLTTNHRFEELDVEKAEAHRQVKLLSNELESANRRVTKLEEELDAAKEEIEARIQHAAKITREFRTSVEEKGKLEKEIKTLHDQIQALQVQLEVNRVDFEQERSDRASAAGRYAEQEEQLRKIIKKTGEELGRKTEEATEIGLKRDRLKRELIQLKEVSVADKRQGPLSIPAEESARLPLVSMPFVSGYYEHKECRPYSQDNEWAISETMDSEKKENPSTSSMSHQGESLNLAMDTVVHNSPQLRRQSQCSVGDIPRPLPCVSGFEEKHLSFFPDHSEYTQYTIHTIPVSDSSSESILPSPLHSHVPVQDSTTTFHVATPSPPNQRYIRDGIDCEIRQEAGQYDEMEPHRCPRNLREGLTAEIHKEAEKLKRNPQDEVYDVPDDTNESIWPFDPNLECPHCGKRFRRGQIREYRYHLDDEHAQSM